MEKWLRLTDFYTVRYCVRERYLESFPGVAGGSNVPIFFYCVEEVIFALATLNTLLDIPSVHVLCICYPNHLSMLMSSVALRPLLVRARYPLSPQKILLRTTQDWWNSISTWCTSPSSMVEHRGTPATQQCASLGADHVSMYYPWCRWCHDRSKLLAMHSVRRLFW